jgi:hypothetical protein
VRRVGFTFDLLAIVVFVVIGRHTHDHGESLGGIASTTWPFLVGLVIAWSVRTATRRSPTTVPSGVEVTAVTVAVGMILRVIAGQGTAFAFVLVAIGFLGLVMVGWRSIWVWIVRRRQFENARE